MPVVWVCIALPSIRSGPGQVPAKPNTLGPRVRWLVVSCNQELHTHVHAAWTSRHGWRQLPPAGLQAATGRSRTG